MERRQAHSEGSGFPLVSIKASSDTTGGSWPIQKFSGELTKNSDATLSKIL